MNSALFSGTARAVAPTSSAAIAVAARDVWKSYRIGRSEVHALRGASLSVSRGEFVTVMGPSGCGKSTLLHTLAGLSTPSSGSVVIDGKEVTRATDGARTALRRERIGFVFQRFNLLPALDVDANLRLAQRISRSPRGVRADAARRAELLSLLGLFDKRRHRPMELSGGEQQRVALARALVHEPAIVLADEPTGNLDSVNTQHVLELFRRVHRSLGQTIVLITHDIEVAEAAERIVLMKDGAVQGREP